ncbi:hypothetical protein HGRIS_002644 [Hohenbuehelia grisea]|uniref:Amidohydrolase-related domain-containing protein n=1 Tax=Hohenbuehelia grisea TaxID=104357 RepID=A0ABR3JMZ4_9AGAR
MFPILPTQAAMHVLDRFPPQQRRPLEKESALLDAIDALNVNRTFALIVMYSYTMFCIPAQGAVNRKGNRLFILAPCAIYRFAFLTELRRVLARSITASMDKVQLRHRHRPSAPSLRVHAVALLASLSLLVVIYHNLHLPRSNTNPKLPLHATESVARCRALKVKPGPPSDFEERTVSDRYVSGTKPYLLKNAKIWTGGENGTEVVEGDILVDKGIIMGVGHFGTDFSEEMIAKDELEVVDVRGAWITPGIVDMHSHLGDGAAPELEGAVDDNSIKGNTQPWLRSLDGLNTHDDSYRLSVSGGVTTALVLPGSANAIGGQAFLIKLRPTAEKTPSSMLLEPPYQINSSFPDPEKPLHWRHMKHACGENPSRVYEGTRMDTIWAFRQAYETARQIKVQQDDYCAKAQANEWDGLGDFPENLQWEALVDVLRGRVKVQIHCYEAVDLDGLVRISNEFKFPISAFHHASEAYLVPDVLKRAYGAPPAIALFATNARYKREAYRSSEFAPRVLSAHGLRVAMKSDHPVLNSRHLLYEAQQAHFYGLPENLAISAVTTIPADVIGMGHRLGHIKKGWDADIVVWDSHPLALGATPTQVFIDGVPQLANPFVVEKPKIFQRSPKVPNFDKEANDAVKFEGLPPLEPAKSIAGTTLFTNVKTILVNQGGSIRELLSAANEAQYGTVLVRGGKIECSEVGVVCVRAAESTDDRVQVVDLEGGSISPGLVSFGAPLGLETINQEPTTNDVTVYDPLVKAVPGIIGGDTSVIRAADGLQLGTRDALLAYRAGVTIGITAPVHNQFFAGLGTAFSVAAAHRLEEGAIAKEITGLHVSVRHFGDQPSISTQIAALRRLFLQPAEGDLGRWFKEVIKGTVPLVVEAHSADIIATLIVLKKEVEAETKSHIRLTVTGASEAHILAKELASASVGVILNPPRPFPAFWENRRILPGPPLTKKSALAELLSHNVTVGLGIEEIWSARNTRFDLAWVSSTSRLANYCL